MAAGRMADEYQSRQIEAVLPGDRTQEIDRGAGVAVRSRPAAAVFREPSIFDAPGGDSFSLEGVGHRSDRCCPGITTPASAVDEHHHGMESAGFRRDPQLAELARLRAVA